MIQYFVGKFPAVYCVLWKLRRFTEICIEDYRLSQDKSVPYPERKRRIKDKYQTAGFPKEMQRREAQMFFDVIISTSGM